MRPSVMRRRCSYHLRQENREEHGDAPAELMKWVWADGRKLKGLVKRRKAEALLYQT